MSEHQALLHLEQLYNESPEEQVLRLCHELAVRPAGVTHQAVFASVPNRDENCHIATILDDEISPLKAEMILHSRHEFLLEDFSEFSKLYLTDRFSDYHSAVHIPPFPACLRKA